MKSAANALLEMFGVNGSIRPAKVESILVSLLYTLNTNKLLGQAIADAQQYARLELESPDSLSYIQSVTSSPELVGLYSKPKAMRLLLHMLPEISMIGEYGVINIPADVLNTIVNRASKSNHYRELKKLLQQINSLNLGYSIIQPPSKGVSEFHIIKANSRAEIIKILVRHGIQTPSVLDSLLKGVE